MDPNQKKRFEPTGILERIGYWFGGSLCFIAILALSFGLAPFFMSVRKGFTMLNIPGDQTLQLKIPGSYMAVSMTKNLPRNTINRLAEIEYSLLSKKGSVPIEISKFPPKIYATDKMEDQIPLFFFTLQKAGSYFLSASYPYNLDGPKVNAVLYHTDLTYVRTELFVGLALFLILGIFGLIFIYKTYKLKKRITTLHP